MEENADQILEWDDDVDVDEAVVAAAAAATWAPVHIKIDPANKIVKESRRRRPATLDDDEEDSWLGNPGFCIGGSTSFLQRLVVVVIVRKRARNREIVETPPDEKGSRGTWSLGLPFIKDAPFDRRGIVGQKRAVGRTWVRAGSFMFPAGGSYIVEDRAG
jgi:hypothetical protein